MARDDMAGFVCKKCGEYHEELPLNFHWPAPDYWLSLSEAEREETGEINDDLCQAGEHRFIHGLLRLPIVGSEDGFTFGVWVSLSQKNFEHCVALWNTAGRENEPPYFGWFSNSLPMYPETLNLKAAVHTRLVGERPTIELEPTDHPLAVDQREGITMARAQELSEAIFHP